LIFEISDLYDFGSGFISSLPRFIWDKGFIIIAFVYTNITKLSSLLNFEANSVIFEQVEGILRDLWQSESRFCHLFCDLQQSTLSMAERETGYEMFFLKVVLVSPNRFRPSAGSPDSDRGVSHFLFCQFYNL
jgi:hypothetical protein